MKARMRFELFQGGYYQPKNGKTVFKPYEDPRWLIHVQSFPGQNGQHQNMHHLHLSRQGELLSWAAHGPEYFTVEPDIMKEGMPAIPLPTDATEADIISLAKQNLTDLYHVQSLENFRYEAAFIYHKHFNNEGQIPIWAVHIYESDTLIYKGVYGYNGLYMSLVPAKQDFYVYTLPSEDFFIDTFGDHYHTELDILSQILYEKTLPMEAIREKLLDWKPLFENWATEHPYSAKTDPVAQLLYEYSDLLE